MSVAPVEALHERYVRIADRFKAVWTYHQFATGIYRNLVDEPAPYEIDFRRVYEGIKVAGSRLNSAEAREAGDALDRSDRLLDAATMKLLQADDRLAPSLVRRFLDKLALKDEEIIYLLIKFYLYADAVEGDRRDKLDFLFTRIGERLMPERGQYVMRDSLEFRQRLIALLSVMRVAEAPRDEVVSLIKAIHSMREEMQQVRTFDEFAERHLFKNARMFKHRIGDLYFDPDVLMAVVDLNVAGKNRFGELYDAEEQRILQDSQQLLRHGDAIERNFGETNPELADAIARFREYKERFDALRAESNVKHDLIGKLKTSMSDVLAQLDRGLEADEEVEELPPAFFDEQRQAMALREVFGEKDPLLPVLTKIASAIDYLHPEVSLADAQELPALRELRMEDWEIAAYRKLFKRAAPEGEEDNEELWIALVRAAALRMKVDEEATILATAIASGVKPEAELLAHAKQSLDLAKALDESFGDFLQEAVYYSNRRILHQLYRSRFRLLRGFSGLWLIYDKQS